MKNINQVILSVWNDSEKGNKALNFIYEMWGIFCFQVILKGMYFVKLVMYRW